jgi:hypothetical protein
VAGGHLCRRLRGVRNLKGKLGCFNGGLLYILYGEPAAIDIPDENMDLYLEKAQELGKY